MQHYKRVYKNPRWQYDLSIGAGEYELRIYRRDNEVVAVVSELSDNPGPPIRAVSQDLYAGISKFLSGLGGPTMTLGILEKRKGGWNPDVFCELITQEPIDVIALGLPLTRCGVEFSPEQYFVVSTSDMNLVLGSIFKLRRPTVKRRMARYVALPPIPSRHKENLEAAESLCIDSNLETKYVETLLSEAVARGIIPEGAYLVTI